MKIRILKDGSKRICLQFVLPHGITYTMRPEVCEIDTSGFEVVGEIETKESEGVQ